MTLPTPTPMPWPRRFLLGAIVLGLGAMIASASGEALAQVRTPQDQANVEALLNSMRGTAPVPCALALSVIEGNGWGSWYGGGIAEDSSTDRLRAWLDHGITDPLVVPVLRAAMAPGDACVRQTAARLLGRTDLARAVNALVEALRDAEPSTRELAAIGLALSDAPAAYAPLVNALRDPEPRVRVASALALGKLGDDRATPELVPLLQRDRDGKVRRAAALALGALD